MNARIKSIRTSLNMTQQEFADKLGINRSNIANYENGVRTPVDAVISLICREFNVSEHWLRTGEGDMRIPRSREAEIEDMVSRALSGTNEFKRAVIRMICTRTEAELEALEKMLWKIVEEVEQEQKVERRNIIKIAGRDGSMEERALTDEEAMELESQINELPGAPEGV